MRPVPLDGLLQLCGFLSQLRELPLSRQGLPYILPTPHLQNLCHSKGSLLGVLAAKQCLEDSLAVGIPGGSPEVGEEEGLHLWGLQLQEA